MLKPKPFSTYPEMSYCKISKEMLLLYFGLDVFCQIAARVPEFYAVFIVQCILNSPQLLGGRDKIQ
jgi:hypothetical protein